MLALNKLERTGRDVPSTMARHKARKVDNAEIWLLDTANVENHHVACILFPVSLLLGALALSHRLQFCVAANRTRAVLGAPRFVPGPVENLGEVFWGRRACELDLLGDATVELRIVILDEDFRGELGVRAPRVDLRYATVALVQDQSRQIGGVERLTMNSLCRRPLVRPKEDVQEQTQETALTDALAASDRNVGDVNIRRPGLLASVTSAVVPVLDELVEDLERALDRDVAFFVIDVVRVAHGGDVKNSGGGEVRRTTGGKSGNTVSGKRRMKTVRAGCPVKKRVDE